MQDSIPQCKCGTLGRLASQTGSPIKYDQTKNQYHLVIGNRQFILRHCFTCGARIITKEPSLKDSVDPQEYEEVMQLARTVRDVNTLTQSIGPPDEMIDPPLDPTHKRGLMFRSSWNSLQLYIVEYQDGRIKYNILPK